MWQKIAPLWSHHPQFTKWRSSPFSRISNPKASLGLEAADRRTQPYLATCNWGGCEATEYQPLVCMEEGNQSGDLAISSGGHGNAQEEYATRRRRVKYESYKSLLSLVFLLWLISSFILNCGDDAKQDLLHRSEWVSEWSLMSWHIISGMIDSCYSLYRAFDTSDEPVCKVGWILEHRNSFDWMPCLMTVKIKPGFLVVSMSP